MPNKGHIAWIMVASVLLAYLYLLWRYAANPPFQVAGYLGPFATNQSSLWDLSSPDEPWSWMKMKRSTLVKLRKANTLIKRELGTPMQINSGHRTDSHNERVGGASQSSHKVGHAVDIASHPTDEHILLWALEEAGFNRIGIYSGHIHADDDPQKQAARWIT